MTKGTIFTTTQWPHAQGIYIAARIFNLKYKPLVTCVELKTGKTINLLVSNCKPVEPAKFKVNLVKSMAAGDEEAKAIYRRLYVQKVV